MQGSEVGIRDMARFSPYLYLRAVGVGLKEAAPFVGRCEWGGK